MNDFRRWTPTEEQYIHDHWRSQSDAEMAKALGRSEGAVRTKRRQLRCSPQKTWMPEDEEYLREAWGRVSIPGIAKHLDRTVNAVKVHVARLGLGAVLANGDYQWDLAKLSPNEYYHYITTGEYPAGMLPLWVK